MIEKFLSLLERLVIAAEKLAGEAPVPKASATPAETPVEKPKRGRPAKAVTPDPEPEGNGLDDEIPDDTGEDQDDSGLGDDEPEAVTKVTKEMMREAMLKYQGLTDGKAARELLQANTSTKSVAFNTVKESEYAQVYNATLKAIATKQKKK